MLLKLFRLQIFERFLTLEDIKRAYVGGIQGSYTETPTVSAPGYMDLITGTWGNKHNVFDNDVKEPNYHYKNIFRLFKYKNPREKLVSSLLG